MRGLGLVVGLVLAGSRGQAMTTDGSLLTNLASGTYQITSGAAQTISYGASAMVIVMTPATVIGKVASPTLQTSGGTVTFCINFVNQSGWASALNIVVTDVVPDNMKYLNGPWTSWATTAGANLYMAWATSAAPATWNVGEPNTGQTSPVGTLFLRWTVDVTGPKQSGQICYKATVN